MKNFVKFIVEGIIGKKVKVEEIKSNGEVTITIICPKEAVGQVLGKEGRTIKSIRTLTRILAIKEDLKINLKVEEA